jgi:hypothetical protein
LARAQVRRLRDSMRAWRTHVWQARVARDAWATATAADARRCARGCNVMGARGAVSLSAVLNASGAGVVQPPAVAFPRVGAPRGCCPVLQSEHTRVCDTQLCVRARVAFTLRVGAPSRSGTCGGGARLRTCGPGARCALRSRTAGGVPRAPPCARSPPPLRRSRRAGGARSPALRAA